VRLKYYYYLENAGGRFLYLILEYMPDTLLNVIKRWDAGNAHPSARMIQTFMYQVGGLSPPRFAMLYLASSPFSADASARLPPQLGERLPQGHQAGGTPSPSFIPFAAGWLACWLMC
jgi:hypothetical protein